MRFVDAVDPCLRLGRGLAERDVPVDQPSATDVVVALDVPDHVEEFDEIGPR